MFLRMTKPVVRCGALIKLFENALANRNLPIGIGVPMIFNLPTVKFNNSESLR